MVWYCRVLRYQQPTVRQKRKRITTLLQHWVAHGGRMLFELGKRSLLHS